MQKPDDRGQTLKALNRVASDIQSQDSVDGVCERTVTAAADILEFELCSVIIREGEWLVPKATSADAPADGSRRMRIDQGLAGETYATGESQLIAEIEENETVDPAKASYRSGISIPLGEYGVFQAVQTVPHGFDDEDLELAELLGRHTATALERIEREQHLRRQNERLDGFAEVVSHDLRSPISVLEGSLELAEQTGDPDHFERARDSLESMRTLVDSLLEQARAGRVVGPLEPVSLATAADGAWETVHSDNCELVVETDKIVRADEDRLQQLLSNLFRNAIDHGDAEVIRVGELDHGFYVADDGSGIDTALREEVFESGVTSRDDGTGFGLAICAEVAEGHGWQLQVATSESGGARFELSSAED